MEPRVLHRDADYQCWQNTGPGHSSNPTRMSVRAQADLCLVFSSKDIEPSNSKLGTLDPRPSSASLLNKARGNA
jgi:hypothetical protein